MTRSELEKEFRNRFHSEPEEVFFCPGRVNIIGEHIDYNGGKVMPCAISLGTYLAVAKNPDQVFRFRSMNFNDAGDVPVKPSYKHDGSEWYYYPLGMINELMLQGQVFSGMDFLFYGNLPVGAGLSSSASIEVLTGFALTRLNGVETPKTTIALMGKKVENEFIGVNCGIMDQFAVAMGMHEKAILLDCDTLDHQYIPFSIGAHTLVIVNTNKERKLTESKYNERFAECRSALERLRTVVPINNLCELTVEQFTSLKHVINDETLIRRANHVVTENERVKQAAAAMEAKDLATLGKLMYESHESLRKDYEVSGRELDTIVEFAASFDGCIGARMTGAGFGGCAIALVQEDRLERFSGGLVEYYRKKIGYEPGVFTSGVGDGVRSI